MGSGVGECEIGVDDADAHAIAMCIKVATKRICPHFLIAIATK
jgi:hypothetical protein